LQFMIVAVRQFNPAIAASCNGAAAPNCQSVLGKKGLGN
jgi:hypothetical protein